MDPLDQVGDPSKGQYGVLKIQTSPLGNESASGNAELNGKNYNLLSTWHVLNRDIYLW